MLTIGKKNLFAKKKSKRTDEVEEEHIRDWKKCNAGSELKIVTRENTRSLFIDL
jgi:hypothetical protein